MTTTTVHTSARRRNRRRAFSLVEVIIGSSIGSFILAGTLAAFIMLTKSGMSLQNYSAAESEIRRGLEDFAQDLRTASNVTWNSSSSITLTLPTPNNYEAYDSKVTYAWDSSTSGTTAGCFYRVPGDSTSNAARTIYIRNVSSLTYARYNRLDATATSDSTTKRIQLTLNVRRTATGLVTSNTTLVSASYTLRNKVAN